MSTFFSRTGQIFYVVQKHSIRRINEKMDSPMRRSGIPVPKSKTSSLKKSMSKSNDDLLSDSIDPQNQSGDLDFFTLLEENIALKEKIEDQSVKHNTSKYLTFWVFHIDKK